MKHGAMTFEPSGECAARTVDLGRSPCHFSVRSVTPTLQSIAERAKFPKREWIASFSADS